MQRVRCRAMVMLRARVCTRACGFARRSVAGVRAPCYESAQLLGRAKARGHFYVLHHRTTFLVLHAWRAQRGYALPMS
eukprot:8873664-Lingulodinium_polyedra.AAC.1